MMTLCITVSIGEVAELHPTHIWVKENYNVLKILAI